MSKRSERVSCQPTRKCWKKWEHELLKSNVDLIVLGISSKGIEWVSDQLSRLYKDKKIPKLNSNVVPIAGWVEDTLDSFLKEHNIVL